MCTQWHNHTCLRKINPRKSTYPWKSNPLEISLYTVAQLINNVTTYNNVHAVVCTCIIASQLVSPNYYYLIFYKLHGPAKQSMDSQHHVRQ